MVFDAHDRAFAFFKGARVRGIYDNMKTAVETIFTGRERTYSRTAKFCVPAAPCPQFGAHVVAGEGPLTFHKSRFSRDRALVLFTWPLARDASCLAGKSPNGTNHAQKLALAAIS